MVKITPLAENNWYDGYESLISNIWEWLRVRFKSPSDAKQEIIKLFEAEIENNKPRKTAGAFEDNYIKYKNEGVKELSITYLKIW